MSHDRRDDQRNDATPHTSAAVSAWLQSLATRAENDPAFAAQMLAALRESGLLGALPAEESVASPRNTPTRRPRTRSAPRSAAAATSETPPPDPFSVYRSQGEAGLRAMLDGLELVSLRAIVRERRLDPARISARWTTRERVITLIVDQVKARANHGHAFERV
jgi:hypothetical protein